MTTTETETGPRDLAAILARIRERNEDLRTRYGHVGGLLVLTKAKDDVPCLIAAVEAVLKVHQGVTDGDYPESRPICDEDGEFWPCPTVTAITRELPSIP